MTAAEVKEALRARYPGSRQGTFVGQWTCIEEYKGIDLLALNAWRKADVIGHEVKVSRGDMRAELLNPWKRRDAVRRCTQFFFAVPSGLLTPDELKFREEDWADEDYQRPACPGGCRKRKKSRYYGDAIPKTGHYITIRNATGHPYGERYELCRTCGGKGYTEKSRVENNAPTLWIPNDAGLITISGRGCKIVRNAPVNKNPEPLVSGRQAINDLVRWVSNRPDPRHAHAR